MVAVFNPRQYNSFIETTRHTQMAYWIHATQAQRTRIVARAKMELERRIREPKYQKSLQQCIDELTQLIDTKQHEISQGLNIRRNLRQIQDLRVELDFHLSELRN
jgi:hypothetical protein